MSSRQPPKWTLILAGVLVFIGFAAGVVLYAHPSAMIPGLDAGVASRMASDMVAGRCIAQAALLALAVASGRSDALRLAFIMRAITEASDLVGNFRAGVSVGSDVFVGVVIALEVAAILALRKSAGAEPASEPMVGGARA